MPQTRPITAPVVRKSPFESGLVLLIYLGLALAVPPLAGAQDNDAPASANAGDADRIMPLEKVHRGMSGYGLTVFHGTEPEPFEIEVLSVAHHYAPRRSVIWVHSEDPRMLESGPVQGMSGSPIYLWEEHEEGEPGKGGRMIGAFAYGFAMSKGCIIGVQPIEYMLEVGRRANADPDANADTNDLEASADERGVLGGDLATAKRTLAQLARMNGQYEGNGFYPAPRLEAMHALLEPTLLRRERGGIYHPDPEIRSHGLADSPPAPGATAPGATGTTGVSGAAGTGERWHRPVNSLPPAPREHDDRGQVVPMLLPMAMGTSELAQLTEPLLRPMGIQPVAGARGGGRAEAPEPAGVDREQPDFVPGGVISVPLAFGDLDLAASGTVTDVLDDGTVLGLGHAMFGEGSAAMPMATGHVHFIVPRLDLSFKLSGSLDIRGSLVRDEIVGVAGRTDVQRFKTAPVNVNVDMPGHETRRFAYQVVDHRRLTPAIATILALESISAAHQPPPESTMHLQGEIRFTGDHPPLELNTMMPGEQLFAVMSELLPPIALAMQNPHEALKLEALDLNVEITPQQRTASIVNAQLDRAEVAPGESIGVTIWAQPHKQPPRRFRATLAIPSNVPEGDYPLIISDARTYLSQLQSLRPHLFTTRNIDDLMGMIGRVMSVRTNAIHLTMHLPEEGIAVGRQELSRLPSSRRAMIFTPTSTVAQPFMEMLEQKIETDLTITGQTAFTIHVRDDRTSVQSAN